MREGGGGGGKADPSVNENIDRVVVNVMTLATGAAATIQTVTALRRRRRPRQSVLVKVPTRHLHSRGSEARAGAGCVEGRRVLGGGGGLVPVIRWLVNPLTLVATLIEVQDFYTLEVVKCLVKRLSMEAGSAVVPALVVKLMVKLVVMVV